MTGVGLDRLLRDVGSGEVQLDGRRFGLLCHQASLDSAMRPAHVALTQAGCMPRCLFAPEHGFYGVEQDMVAATACQDPLTGSDIVSLYRDDEESLVPSPSAFEGLDLLIIDLQDVGARYYTFAATAVWAAEVAIRAGCEVWVLDRPNPLGGCVVEGNFVDQGLESFVSAFSIPVRHGLTLAELMLFELSRRQASLDSLRIFRLEDWEQRPCQSLAAPFVAPSPNMPTLSTAMLYPGLCLVEGTELSEGRGTTRPFHLVGAPFVDSKQLVAELQRRASRWDLGGVVFVPSYFRPQFQKHAGEVCGGVELVVRDRAVLDPVRLGVMLLQTFRDLWPDEFRWRTRAYEFVADRPAIDLLAGSTQLRALIDQGDDSGLRTWVGSWGQCEEAFRRQRGAALLYGRAGNGD